MPLASLRGEPRIGLALGSGAARGLAHIPVLEAFDELGVRPAAIAGTSMGAVIGAAYAAGHSGKALREHALVALRDPVALGSRLVQVRPDRFSDYFSGFGSLSRADPEKLLRAFWPGEMPSTFDALGIRFRAVATDMHAREEVVIGEGDLCSAVAASMAIPGVLKPVLRDGRLLVDGVAVNPVPVQPLARLTDVTVAVEVNLVPADHIGGDGMPGLIDAMLAGFAVMEHRLMRERFRRSPPDVHLVPDVGRFAPFDFFRSQQILAAADPIRDIAKREIARLLEREPW